MTEHKILSGPIFPFDVRTDYVKVTDEHRAGADHPPDQERDITFETKDGVAKGVVNILGKVTTLTHKTVQTFEDTVEVEQPAELLEKITRPQVDLLEGRAAASGPLPARYRHQGREQPGSHRDLRKEPRCAQVSRRKARHFVA